MARRVLVASLVGFQEAAEWRRLEQTIDATRADRVLCLVLPPEREEQAHVRDYVYRQLEHSRERNPFFSFDKRPVDFDDLEEALAAYASAFAEEAGADVSVLLGSPGPAGAAATMACLVWRKPGIFPPDPASAGGPPRTLPSWIRLERLLGDDEIRLLGIVVDEQDGLDKKTIIERLKERGRIRKEQDKHAYRRLNTRFLPRLQHLGFVEVGPRDDWDQRHHFVRATESGRKAYQILSLGVREPSATLHVRGGAAGGQAREGTAQGPITARVPTAKSPQR